MFRGIILIHNSIGTIKLHVFQLMIDLWQNLRIRLYIQYAVVNYRQINHATKMHKSIKQKFESTIVTWKDNTAYIKHHVQSIVNIIIKQYYMNITLIIINSIG